MPSPTHRVWPIVGLIVVAAAARLDSSLAESHEIDPARSKALAELDVERWHRRGNRGAGVTIAVLDTGFRGYRTFLGNLLPSKVTAKSFRVDGNLEARDSQHGILCGEVIHAIAPDARLLFANWEADRPETFLNAVRWAKSQGARIATCSVIMPSWSDGEGGGAVHSALGRHLGPGSNRGDVLFFACAGNVADRHWAGPFLPGRDGFAQWKPGIIDNTITPWGDDRVSVELCWKPGGRYTMQVVDDAGVEVNKAVVTCSNDRCTAVVRFEPRAGERYRVRVRLIAGVPSTFHLVSLGAWLEYHTAPGSIPFPGDGSETVTIGAVDAEGRRMSYSACGSSALRTKPDFVAAVPFPSSARSRPFSGTSAATPQAAALAALVWSRYPDLTAARVREVLCRSSRDLGPPGHDPETGFGLIRLPRD